MNNVRVSDWVFAAIVLADGLVGLLVATSMAPNFGIPALYPQYLVAMLLVIVVQTGLMLFRRAQPEVAFLGIAACAALICAIPTWQSPMTTAANGSSTILAAYSVAALTKSLPRGGAAVAFGSIFLGTVQTLLPMVGPEQFDIPAVFKLVSAVLGSAIAFAIGYTVRNNALLTKTLREKAELAEQNAAMVQEAAILEERSRIARELHDTTAHHLSAIAIQTNAARALLKVSPGAAESHLMQVSDSTSRALDDVRATVGKLRTPLSAAESSRTPQPNLTMVPELLAENSGLGMNLTTTGELPQDLPKPLQNCIYRVLQEALTNARKHAPGAPVSVAFESDSLRVTTSGTFTFGPSGRGSLSMAERAAAVGAVLHNEPTSEGWLVSLDWSQK